MSALFIYYYYYYYYYKLPNVFEFSDVVHVGKELIMVAILELEEVSLRRFQHDFIYKLTKDPTK